MEKLGVGAACSFRKGKRRRRERVGVGLLSKHMQPRVYHGIFQAPPDESEGRNGVGLVVIYLLPHFTSLPTTVVCICLICKASVQWWLLFITTLHKICLIRKMEYTCWYGLQFIMTVVMNERRTYIWMFTQIRWGVLVAKHTANFDERYKQKKSRKLIFSKL